MDGPFCSISKRPLRRIAWGAVAAVMLLIDGRAVADPPKMAIPATAATKPMRIMSLSLCTDLLLLQLVPRSRIASVTYVAHGGAQALFPGADKGVAVNHGAAEDIIAEKPDLILASDYAAPATLRLAARALRTPVVQVQNANSFAEIRQTIRQVGAAVGEPERAEGLIRRMDATLAEIGKTPLRKPLRVVAWGGGDSVPGKGTLANTVIEAAGGVNIAATPDGYYSTFDVEQLLLADPDALVYARPPFSEPSLRGDEGQHRIVRTLYGGRRIAYNEAASTCGLPQSATSALSLHRAFLTLPEKKALF